LLEVESFIRTSKEKKEVPAEKSDWWFLKIATFEKVHMTILKPLTLCSC
jgi:ribosomal protein S19E (S16A)